MQGSDWQFKILIIGDSHVGKSTLLLRYTEEEFVKNLPFTIGVDFKIKTISLNNMKITLQLWDTAGQERFRTLTSSYYRGAHAIVIVYDVTDKFSLEHVKDWIQEIDRHADPSVVKVLVASKADIEDMRAVLYEEGAQIATYYDIPFYETSAKTGKNVNKLFERLTEEIHQTLTGTKEEPQRTIVFTKKSFQAPINDKSGKKKCC